MNYKNAHIVLFPLQFGAEEGIDSETSFAWAQIPTLALQRTKLHCQGNVVHLKQYIEKEIIILPYFSGYYKKIMGKDLAWKDPLHCLVQDVNMVLQNTNSVFWIYATPKDANGLFTLFSMITHEVHLYNGLLEDSKTVLMEFPNFIAI